LKKPLIADYDLLAIISPLKEYSREHIRLNPDITHQKRLRKISPQAKRRSMESEERFYAREDATLGNVSSIIKKHITGLNRALNKGEYLECIHHNDDAGSPASNPETNYPITAIIPPIANFKSTIFLLKTTEEFVDFIHKINREYRVEANPLWELPVQWAVNRSHFFSSIKLAYIWNKSPENIKNTVSTLLKNISLDDETFSQELTQQFKVISQMGFEDDNSLFEKFLDTIENNLFNKKIPRN
jgi:hypothetical protein